LFIVEMQPTGYIFSYIITGTEEAPFPHICGKTNYGDNVGDLWFITYLLNKLTTQIDGLVVK